ncbi:hypothetical protein BDU57DRAFT_478585 [Ampelomyces quisqualis]|uniref:Uncharacterized protein n=1 Tax=Ampelomyces quisqualis TaxID=50730 RepID=A0A6A5QFZ3_AMPQU|nr:hypothetical protein BDU57DRAFT_478585 [Ampelomyces quisqualis]
MDPSHETRLAPSPITGYSYHEYAPPAIEPCATFFDESGAKAPGRFHLISCGHLVAVVESDRRCGRNCHHAFTLANAQTAASDSQNRHIASYHSLSDITTQAFDLLYCETCNGIPVDRYKIMKPSEGSSQLRRAVALTRPVLSGALMLQDHQIDATLCSPVFRANQEFCSEHTFHKLLCGHLVLSMSQRFCASNCVDSLHGSSIRQSDAIVCLECVTRAEMIFQRYARLQERAKSGVDGLGADMDPQSLSRWDA